MMNSQERERFLKIRGLYRIINGKQRTLFENKRSLQNNESKQRTLFETNGSIQNDE